MFLVSASPRRWMTKCQQVGECLSSIHDLLNSLYTYLNPCEKFHLYVCGKYILKERVKEFQRESTNVPTAVLWLGTCFSTRRCFNIQNIRPSAGTAMPEPDFYLVVGWRLVCYIRKLFLLVLGCSKHMT